MATQASNSFFPGVGDLPAELTCRPMGFVALTGLDVVRNAIHRSIWESFSANRRPDRVPLTFRILDGDHEYPKCSRIKRTTYDWYIPKGILKTNWMRKHLRELPALVVVFFDLDWNDQQWKERQVECASRVEVVRASLEGRGIKVAVVLVQQSAPLPPGEDMMAAERAASLCSACELSAKSLYVLPHTDHLLGYIIRLENAFYDLTLSHYHTEARRVKSHKEFLNKTTHQLLFVRHAFKIGFFNELKQDTNLALKQYRQSYASLTEMITHETHMLEIKTIAGFINFKICKLSFVHNAPLDAIAQFRKHIDFFKPKVGNPVLTFEHKAWTSKQFQIFGDLFDEAIRLGLNAIQTQHPGFYYQQAALHAIERKRLATQLCQEVEAMPEPNPLEEADRLDYYGQRVWRQGHQSIDPPDALKEKEGIQALQFKEKQVDHSWIIIPLLSSAVAQFKKYKSVRMKRYLMVQMGEEYFHSKDYSKALMLLNRVVWDYRAERWWTLLTSVLTLSLRAAYLGASLKDYIVICLELLGRMSTLSVEEKTRIQMNLIRVMSSNPPEPEGVVGGLAEGAVEEARALWEERLAPDHAHPSTNSGRQDHVLTVDMRHLVPFVECKVRFTSSKFTADQIVSLEVYLRSACPFPIQFSKLSLLLSNPSYNAQCVVADGNALSPATVSDFLEEGGEKGDLYLTPGQLRRHTFQLVVLPQDVGKQLKVSSVALVLGSEGAGHCAILHWQGGGGDAASLTHIQEAVPRIRRKHSQHAPGGSQLPLPDWDATAVQESTRIEARIAKLQLALTYDPPALVNEYFCVKVLFDNLEASPISFVRWFVDLLVEEEEEEEAHSKITETTKLSLDLKTIDSVSTTSLSDDSIKVMQPHSQVERLFYMRCLDAGQRRVKVKVCYNLEVNPEVSPAQGPATLECACQQVQEFKLDVLVPYEVTTQVMSLKCQPLEYINAEEEFLFLLHTHCKAPTPLNILTTQFTASRYLKPVEKDVKPYLETVKLGDHGVSGAGDGVTSECYCLVSPYGYQHSIPIGTYSIVWRRCGQSDAIPYVSTAIICPNLGVETAPLYLQARLPSWGYVRRPLELTYTLYNRTMLVLEVEASLQVNDLFMFSGHKQVCFRILPRNQYTLTYSLYPLVPGKAHLPQLRLNLPRYPDVGHALVERLAVDSIYVKPQGRQSTSKEPVVRL